MSILEDRQKTAVIQTNPVHRGLSFPVERCYNADIRPAVQLHKIVSCIGKARDKKERKNWHAALRHGFMAIIKENQTRYKES